MLADFKIRTLYFFVWKNYLWGQILHRNPEKKNDVFTVFF